MVDPIKQKQAELNNGPRMAFTKSRPMPIRTRRMVQIARLVNGMPVTDALQQLRFCNKKQYPLDKVIHNASNLMSIRYGLQPSDLMISSICVGTSFLKKRLDIKGRGHMGMKKRSYSNVYVVVKEGKPQLSKYGEKRRAAKLEKQARIKREFREKQEQTIEFIWNVCSNKEETSYRVWMIDSIEPDWKRVMRTLLLSKTRPFESLPDQTR